MKIEAVMANKKIFLSYFDNLIQLFLIYSELKIPYSPVIQFESNFGSLFLVKCLLLSFPFHMGM